MYFSRESGASDLGVWFAKVGAALSMAYITGQPVVFVGTGQKYQNLKKLSVSLPLLRSTRG